MGINLEELGITQSEIQERVVDAMVERLMGKGERREDSIRNEIENAIQARVKEAVDALIVKILSVDYAAKLETMLFKECNLWGEKTGKTLTLRDIIIARVEAYINQTVDDRGDPNGYSDKKQTRLTRLINTQLHGHIEQAVKAVITDATKILNKSVEDTVRLKLAELSQTMVVQLSPTKVK